MAGRGLRPDPERFHRFLEGFLVAARRQENRSGERNLGAPGQARRAARAAPARRMLQTPSQEKRSAAPPVERPLRGARLAAVLLLGILCQALVIFWIAASEIPARVFISSWSVSMPGVLLLGALALLAPGSWLLAPGRESAKAGRTTG